MKNIIRKVFILTSIFCVIHFASAQYQWTTPVPIDTSTYPSSIGGAMALDDSANIYATFASTYPGKFLVVRSTDQGSTWMQYEYTGPELSRVPRDIVADHNGNVWLLWISWESEFAPAYLNLSKSIDSGRTFTTLFSSLSYFDGHLYQKLAVDAQNSIYMLWDDVQFKLTKFRFGDINQRVDAEIPNDTLLIGSWPSLTVSKDFVVHCAWEGSFYDPATGYHEFVFYSRSTDSGATFQGRTRIDTADIVGSWAYVHHLPALAVDSTGIVFVSYTRELAVNQSDVRIVRSTDGGQTFLKPLVVSGTDTAYAPALCIDSERGVNILWNAHGTYHNRSTDGGTSFTSSTYVGNIGLHDLKPSEGGFLYITGEYNSRMCFTKTNIILSVPMDAAQPCIFTLFPSYPNPFNSSTTIRFSVATTELIDVRLFDMIGREVDVLVSERLGPGTYSARWDATNMSSGVYFVRFVAGRNLVATRKMILMR